MLYILCIQYKARIQIVSYCAGDVEFGAFVTAEDCGVTSSVPRCSWRAFIHGLFRSSMVNPFSILVMPTQPGSPFLMISH